MATSFASAAAGNGNSNANLTRDINSEWARRTNGATQTFRRSSTATTVAQASHAPVDTSAASSNPPPRYVPPHRNGMHPDTRYSKDQLLDLFRSQAGIDGALRDGLPGLYVGGWQPETNASQAAPSWGRPDHARDAQPGPDACWDKDGLVEPIGLLELDDEERDRFASSVNTPLKPPVSNKESQQANGLPGRKVSISGATTPGGFGLPSPSLSRGLGRRRETSESFPFPSNGVASPTAGRDDHRAPSPPPSLLRRRTDIKDSDKADEVEGGVKTAAPPFGGLKRHQTGPLSAGFAAPSSPWSNAPASAGPMGSFGSFGAGNVQDAQGEKRTAPGSGRAESRFKSLLSKDSTEDISQRTVESKPSMSNLPQVKENESWRSQVRQDPGHTTFDQDDDGAPSGSAALAAESELSPQHPMQSGRGFGTPSKSSNQDEFGFGAFGMTSDNAHGFGQGLMQSRDAFQHTPASQRMGLEAGGHEPMSPTDTNPYQSPDQHGTDRQPPTDDGHDTDGSDAHNPHLPGLGGFGQDPGQHFGGLGGLGGFNHLGRTTGIAGPASDRSQTSSVGAHRGFAGLGGLGQLAGTPGAAPWPSSQGGFGTPGRQSAGLVNPFGGNMFAPSKVELQSPSLAGLGSSSLLGPQAGAPGSSRMASMFPAAMQDHMRQGESRADDTRASHQTFSDHEQESQTSPEHASAHFGTQSQGLQQPSVDQPHQQQLPSVASNQPPQPQQRTMVMPDRMRWIYRDPQGQTQGPWSGLEMHDWYKAGFFSPELLVKKYEDADYEPLAQLIRRIGNSREPFLVPQIGIPHGPASSTGPAAWSSGTATGSVGAAVGTSTVPSTGAQPPFASSFPSFGTTLTADQQNALERRKQEEQYLMARQKEHLAQAQIAQRMQMQGGHGPLLPSQLHHHSSAHSLHSQPSFGSITSPNAYQASPIQTAAAGGVGHAQGFFDNSFRAPQAGAGVSAVGAGVDSLGHIREEEIPGIMDRLNASNRLGAGQFGAPGQPFPQQQQQGQQSSHDSRAQQVQQMLQDRARLQQEQTQHDATNDRTVEGKGKPNERLQEFQALQGQGTTMLDARFQPTAGKAVSKGENVRSRTAHIQHGETQSQEPLSLTEQVQKAASAQDGPSRPVGLPQPFPPAPSQSPLPAPAAQRTGRQSVADQLQTSSRDRSETPSTDTPSVAVAPWAKEPAEAPKGPSLKEIQEAEARKAAEEEEIASAARRAAFQREMEAQAQAITVVAPGLPASASWGATGSPATPTNATSSPWGAKVAQKPSGPTSAKSMAQIQKEEEARKRRQATLAASAQASALSAVPAVAVGKSYANLAGKISIPAPAAGGAWTTVGAGGKMKTPIVQGPPAARAVSSSTAPTLQTTAKKAPSRTASMATSGGANAQDEFKKWAVGELRTDLNKMYSADEFVANLVALGTDVELITEAVHSASTTLDSRHFAEEFLRRKKLADKGLVDHTALPKSASPFSAAGQQSGGWSEVAKKGPQKDAAAATAKEESNGSFRVVAAKKKGGKR
nr:gyf domain-containing protein mpd2 [Quercus suber]